MDNWSWMPLHGGNGDGAMDSERSYGSGQHEEQDVALISSHMQQQQQLKQSHMLMDTEVDGYAATVPPIPSPSWTTFCSNSGCSPDESSLLMLTGSATTTTSFLQPVEVSSLQSMPLSPIAYDDDHGLRFSSIDTILNLDDLIARQPHQEQARRKNGHEPRGAFRPYARHLSPRKNLKPGTCGQRAFRAAMSALTRMHVARLAHWQSVRMKMAAPPPPVGNSNYNQLQHVLLERKRREKLNDSFKVLRTVLPPGTKKDRASTLIRARDYVNTLKSKVSELEEKNKMLVESQLHGDNGNEQDYNSGEQIEVEIIKTASAEEESQEFRLKIAVGSGQNAMDAVVTILKSFKEIGDVSLMAMDTRSKSSGLGLGKDFQIAAVPFQATSSRCDNSLLKESK